MTITDPFFNKLILVVEDDYSIRETLRDALESDGFRVLTAQNGRDALELLSAPGSEMPQLILLDLMMPIMGGVEFLGRVAVDTKLAPIPVVIVSASATDENSKGAAAFMKKPPDLEFLLAMVRRFIEA